MHDAPRLLAVKALVRMASWSMAVHWVVHKYLEGVVGDYFLLLVVPCLMLVVAWQEMVGTLPLVVPVLVVQASSATGAPSSKVVRALAWPLVASQVQGHSLPSEVASQVLLEPVVLAFLALQLEVVHPSLEVEAPRLAPNLSAEKGAQGSCSGTNLRDGIHRSRLAHQLGLGCGLSQ